MPLLHPCLGSVAQSIIAAGVAPSTPNFQFTLTLKTISVAQILCYSSPTSTSILFLIRTSLHILNVFWFTNFLFSLPPPFPPPPPSSPMSYSPVLMLRRSYPSLPSPSSPTYGGSPTSATVPSQITHDGYPMEHLASKYRSLFMYPLQKHSI